nr:MAG TPA: Intron-binding protein aquarius N-terminus [Caudoviricetes sp.]
MATHDPKELAHYGVLGMKWGVRKEPERGTGSAVKTSDEKKQIVADRAAAEQAKLDRKAAAKAAKKAAKDAERAAKKAASGGKKSGGGGGGKKGGGGGKKSSGDRSAERAQKKAEAARKKLERQKLSEARKAERAENKRKRDLERAAKKAEAEKKKTEREAEKKRKEQERIEKKNQIPRGGLTREQRNAKPRNLTTTDLIEQNKRLQLEKTNSELKAKLAEYEKANRSQFAKMADTFMSEAGNTLTKYAAKKATDLLIGAVDSKLSVGNIKDLASEADRATGLSDIIKKKDKK